jgi:putative heme iron utilization protein
MSEIITAAVSDRICKHMNNDHADAVLTYATHFGQRSDAEAAKMLALDETGMDLEITVSSATETLRIPFPQTLTDAKDAHTVLVDMMKAAQGNPN